MVSMQVFARHVCCEWLTLSFSELLSDEKFLIVMSHFDLCAWQKDGAISSTGNAMGWVDTVVTGIR